MFTLESFHAQYDAESTEVVINGKPFTFLVPKTIDPFIDPDDPIKGFPLWAKIWEGAAILAGHLASLPVDPAKRMLEIGSGLGIVGIVAACHGHRVTMTEYNQDALNFARANMLLNPAATIDIDKLDWTDPQIEGQFDYVVGSEVIYKKSDIQPLAVLFKRYLKPGGEIILVEGVRETGLHFWKAMGPDYHVKAQKKSLRSKSGTNHLVMFQLKSKKG